jgi:hypothetical protein
MSRSSLAKLRARLALVAYFRETFGVDDPNDPESVRAYYDTLNGLNEGYTAEGRSHVSQFVASQADTERLSMAQLLGYDRNVKRHTEEINKRRDDPITWKSFQILAALMTEAYLDRVVNDPGGFLERLNGFVAEQNEENKGRITFPEFEARDLNKLAFWMATGSGKTLLMHLNYYQYLHYAERSGDLPENVLLVTPNEGLSRQHIEKLRESSIACRHFNAETADLWSVGENPVKVIEIQKLVEEKSGGGLSVEVDAFEGRNLVFVDEGHKGAGSDTQAWRNRRERIAEEGFTFEYSATFGQAIASESTALQEEYGRAILFDYSYPRFYEDGYGKDYRILNLENAVDPELRDRYLLSNLLTFYEQVHVFNSDPETFRNTYNIEFPLLVFIGHTVNAGKTRSSLGKADERSLADVEELLLFLGRVLRNEDEWVPEAIDAMLRGETDWLTDHGTDLFDDGFSALNKTDLTGAEVYENLLEDVFHVSASSTLELVDITSAEGEIGLRASGSDAFFGVINIGNDRAFLKRANDHDTRLTIEEDEFTDSLFHSINKQDSSINVLLGSRKFIEGWDSWRVSTMGLMNFGRGEGPQVIQLFGRGVRLLGRNRTLKRSEEFEEVRPRHLPRLETLHIFGVRADYMAQFRNYLSEEGIDTDPREVVRIETRTRDHFEDQGLLTVRPETDSSFTELTVLYLEATDEIHPKIDVFPQVGAYDSRTDDTDVTIDEERRPKTISREFLPLLDWNEVYREIWQFRTSKGYSNLIAEKAVFHQILLDGHYELYCPDELLDIDQFGDLERIHEIVVMILRKYIEEFYSTHQRRWEQSRLTYVPMDDELGREQGNFIDEHVLAVKTDAEEFLEDLREVIETDELYSNDDGIPNRVHFDRHLYLPLIAQEASVEKDDVNYSPPALNSGERKLVEQLRDHFQSTSGRHFLDKWEVFLLRNQSRGRGVGLLVGNQRFFPDFIMWLQNKHHQHIVFLEPHGLALEGDPLENHRVQFRENIESYEQELTARTGRRGVSLHSYVISQTDFDELAAQARLDRRDTFHDHGIYFADDDIEEVLRDVVGE